MSTNAHELPAWLSTESQIRGLFDLLGFRTENVSIVGRQIDLRAQRIDTFALAPEKWAIEITTEYVGADKGSKDYQKLALAQKDDPGTRLMLISTSGFTDDQRASLNKLGVLTATYAELEARALAVPAYCQAIRVERKKAVRPDVGYHPDVFVDPALKVQSSNAMPESTETIGAVEWVKSIAKRPVGVVGALLGDLGTGKTTVLQRAQLDLLDEFEMDPSNSVLPVYVQLNRYKHHSGRVDSLLHEVFAGAGFRDYPTALIRHLFACGRIVLFFDGLDEVHPIQDIDDVIGTVTNILDYVGHDGRAIVSARTHLFATKTEELAIFGPYEKARVEQASKKLRDLLSGRASTEIAHIQRFTPGQIDQYLRAACGPRFDEVRSRIESVYGFREMASTPVLLAMMRTTIPEMIQSGADFGPFPQLQLYRAYTERWIDRDEGRAQLSRDQRLRLSKGLAEKLLARDESAATWGEIREFLRADPAWVERPVGESAAEIDVRNSTFLIREDRDYFRFVHRSIMEYFAALVSVDKITTTGHVDRTLSDGHAEFVALGVAAFWHTNPNSAPMHKRDLDTDRWEDAQLLSVLSAASVRLPRDSAEKSRLAGLRVRGAELGAHTFANCRVIDCNFQPQKITRLEFDGCEIENLSISTSGKVGILRFNRCRVRGSTLRISKNEWRAVDITPSSLAPGAAVSVPTEYVRAAEWVELGNNSAELGGVTWRVPVSCLLIAEEVVRRLGTGKRSLDSWRMGSFGTELERLLPTLKKAKIVKEDASRNPHQIGLGQSGKSLVSGLKSGPDELQDLLLNFALDGKDV